MDFPQPAADHSHAICAQMLLHVVLALHKSDAPDAAIWLSWSQDTGWLDWYLAHHCKHCGACDDRAQIENGLCSRCFHDLPLLS